MTHSQPISGSSSTAFPQRREVPQEIQGNQPGMAGLPHDSFESSRVRHGGTSLAPETRSAPAGQPAFEVADSSVSPGPTIPSTTPTSVLPREADGWNLVGLPAQASPKGSEASAPGFDPANLDLSVRPQEDFYQYAVGGYLRTHPIPPDRTSWGVDGVLVAAIQAQLRDILDEAGRNSLAGRCPHGSNEQKIGDFYASGMDTATINAAGIRPLAGEFDRIDRIHSLTDLGDVVAHLHARGLGCLFGFGGGQDAQNAEMVIGQAWQGGLGLPDRDYYLKDDEGSHKIRDAYIDHVARMFELMGDPGPVAQAEAVSVMAVETRLAQAQVSKVDLRDPKATYNPMDGSGLARLTPHFDWQRYFGALGLDDRCMEKVNVGTPSFFNHLEGLLTSVPLSTWKTYLRWHLVNHTAPCLSTPFEQEDFNFDKVLTGVEEQTPRWKRMTRTTDHYLGEALGQKFVAQSFPPEAKARALELIQNIKETVREKIRQNTWMSDPTREEALKKVDTLVAKIGYPDRWKDYSSLQVDRGVFIDNVMRAREFQSREDLLTIGKPVDHGRWQMTPATLNAYYDAGMNEIVFPAGILQPPYFDPKGDDAANYGSIGAVMGHELTHGFDDEGSQYDARGNLRNWWTPVDLERFKKLADGVADQFGEFEFDGQKVDGRLVEGEAIADLGGLELAYTAFKRASAGRSGAPAPDGFTPDQRFFLSYALSWADNIRPEYAHLIMTTDPHPLNKFRVNGPLSNQDAFYQAFGVNPGDAMMRPRENRNALWNA